MNLTDSSPSRNCASDLIAELIERNNEWWRNESHCCGEMRELGVPDDADAPRVSMGDLRAIEKALSAPNSLGSKQDSAQYFGHESAALCRNFASGIRALIRQRLQGSIGNGWEPETWLQLAALLESFHSESTATEEQYPVRMTQEAYEEFLGYRAECLLRGGETDNALAPGERKPGEIAGPLNDSRESARVQSTATGQRDRASQERVSNPGFQPIGHVIKNEYGFVSAHIPNLGDIAVGTTPIFAAVKRAARRLK